MSDETNYEDPWATGADEPPADDAPDDEFGDILADLDLEETETDEEIRVRDDSSKKYDNPYDVGLEDGMWVPLRIITSEVNERHVPRFSSRTCIAKGQIKDPKTGKMKPGTFVLYDQVEEALGNGGEEIISEVPLPYFVCTANHAAPRFNQRRWDYEIEVPVFSIKTALFNKSQRNRTGYKNELGPSLRKATGALKGGDQVTKANMAEVADRMVDTIVMARLSISQSKKQKFRPRLDENNNQIMVQADPASGDAVVVFKQSDGSGYVVDDGTGTIWEGDESLLVPFAENRFAIRDDSDMAAPLMEGYFPINDYIARNTPFLPLPERKVSVTRAQVGADGEPVRVEGEITLDTIGAIARGATAGIPVDVLLRTGETITATWFGTEWVEKPSSDGNSMEQFVGGDAQEDEQDKALASL